MGYLSKGDRITSSEQDIIDIIGALGTPLYFLRVNAAGTSVEWASVSGAGDVVKVGTPVNNQVGVWTGDGSLEGDTALTFDTATDILTSGIFRGTALTASELLGTDASKNIVSLAVATYPSLTELTYLKGVTSSVQTQLNGKQASMGADDNYVTDAEKTVIGNTSGTNTGDQNISSLVTGPASATDNAIARYNSTTGKIIEDSSVLIDDNGRIKLGGADGSAMVDVIGATDSVQGLRIQGNGATAISFSTYVAADNFLRFSFLSTGEMIWGSGAVSGDTNLYRSGANTLKTDDSFVAVGTITGSNLSGTNTGDQNLSGYAALGSANAFSVGGQTITVADTTNVVGLTIKQNDATNDPIALVVNGPSAGNASKVTASTLVQYNDETGSNSDWSFNVAGTSSHPTINLQNTGGTLASPTATPTGVVGSIDFYAYNSTPAQKQIGAIKTYLSDGTDTSEDSYMYFSTIASGVQTIRFQIGNDINGIHVGANSSTGIVSSFGNQDITIQTGNATTGSITIVDGANGNISLTPNGTGAVAVSTTLELGHATDTTLSRVSAGVIAVEGVRVQTTTSLVVSAASYTTDTGTSLNMDNLDMFIITAQAGALLFNAPGGTLAQGRNLIIRIKDNGTARALTWNAVFRAMGTALPSTTVLSKTLYLGFKYNSTDTKWDLLASAQEA